MFLDGGIGALPKVLEAYIDEAVWPPNPPKAERHGLRGVWYGELTISIAECQWLALMTLARIEKSPS